MRNVEDGENRVGLVFESSSSTTVADASCNDRLTALVRSPLLYYSCSLPGAVCGLGDVVAQQCIEKRGGQHEWRRSRNMALIGLLFTVG